MKELKKKMGPWKLSERQMKSSRGGEGCYCGCVYVNCGGSSDIDNGFANLDDNLSTPSGAGC